MKKALPIIAIVTLLVLTIAPIPYILTVADNETVDLIAQLGVGLLGIIAIILVSKKNRWGFVFGLASQPFWFATALVNHQWGTFFLSICYAISWIYGFYLWFLKKPKEK